MNIQAGKPLLVRIQYRGFYIEAVPFFSLKEPGWKAKALIWRHTGEPVEQFVDDPTGATFSTRSTPSVQACFWGGSGWSSTYGVPRHAEEFAIG